MANSLYLRGKGMMYTVTLDELNHPKPVDNRTGDEVALDVINGLGLTLR
jgi:hypothetical protein